MRLRGDAWVRVLEMEVMKCSTCNGSTSVYRTTPTARIEVRERRCEACQERWETTESETPGTRRRHSAAVTNSAPVAAWQHVATNSGPVAPLWPPGSSGGVGGGLPSESDLIRSGSDQAPSEPPDQTPARVKAAPKYDAAFEREWEGTRKLGSKLNAFKAWVALGKPAFAESWAAWSKLDGWRRGFVPHVSTWLNDRRFEQKPAEAAKPPADTRCHFHRAPGTRGKRPPAGWIADCPECKHGRAGSAGRASEPTSVTDLAAQTEARLARARAVVPATAEQIAELRRQGGRT
jgi:hypothetical protein